MSRKKKAAGASEAADPSRRSTCGAGQDNGVEADAEARADGDTDSGAGVRTEAGSAAQGDAGPQLEQIEGQLEGAEHRAPSGQTEQDELRAQLADSNDRLLRALAEIDNLRKRSRREVADARRFAQADVLRPLLEVLDNFHRALQHADAGPVGSQDAVADSYADDPGVDDRVAGDRAPAGPQTDAALDSFFQGVVLIAQSFRQALHDCGVRRIEALGRPFDPMLHEAVGQAPADENTASGTILADLQTGYTFDDLVLRASRVIVAQ